MPESTVRFFFHPSLIKAAGFDIIKKKPPNPQQYLQAFALQVQRSVLRETENFQLSVETSGSYSEEKPTTYPEPAPHLVDPC